ncbi:hypothetical protein SK128_008475, partial [Halocaridina rubra]
TITCDCDATIYIRIITTRTQGEVTTESEYACAVRPIRGRLNIAAITEKLLAVVKFDGWPEVSITLEGIRNNATGLHEQSIIDVVSEVVASAVRNAVLDLNLENVSTFPRFRRARQAPDKIIPVGYDSMVRELQTHPPSVQKKLLTTSTMHHEEEIQEAGESFTALSFSTSLSQQGVLTTSEEQLILRNLNKYPSLENTEMETDEYNEWQKSWEENYVPASKLLFEEQKTPTEIRDIVLGESKAPTETTDIAFQESKEEPQAQNFVLVASNRSKLIDEPRPELTIEEIIDEDEPEPVVVNAEDEPCLRRAINGTPRDSILGTPVAEPPKKIEDEDEEDIDIPLRLEEMEFLDKSLTGTSGVGPLPALPGLQKGPFVSGACGVEVNFSLTAESSRELKASIETASNKPSVASNLPECDQEVSDPSQTLLQPQPYNQSAPDDPSVCSLSDTANIPDDFQVSPPHFASYASSSSLEPETTAASAFHEIESNRSREVGPCLSAVRNSSTSFREGGVFLEGMHTLDSKLIKKDMSQAADKIRSDNSNQKNSGKGSPIYKSAMAGNDTSTEVITYSQRDELKFIDDSESDGEIIGRVIDDKRCPVDTSAYEYQKKWCLNEFTDTLFQHLELHESEFSLPEENIENLPFEIAEIYDNDDKNLVFTEDAGYDAEESTSDLDSETRCSITDNECENENKQYILEDDSEHETGHSVSDYESEEERGHTAIDTKSQQVEPRIISDNESEEDTSNSVTDSGSEILEEETKKDLSDNEVESNTGSLCVVNVLPSLEEASDDYLDTNISNSTSDSSITYGDTTNQYIEGELSFEGDLKVLKLKNETVSHHYQHAVTEVINSDTSDSEDKGENSYTFRHDQLPDEKADCFEGELKVLEPKSETIPHQYQHAVTEYIKSDTSECEEEGEYSDCCVDDHLAKLSELSDSVVDSDDEEFAGITDIYSQEVNHAINTNTAFTPVAKPRKSMGISSTGVTDITSSESTSVAPDANSLLHSPVLETSKSFIANNKKEEVDFNEIDILIRSVKETNLDTVVLEDFYSVTESYKPEQETPLQESVSADSHMDSSLIDYSDYMNEECQFNSKKSDFLMGMISEENKAVDPHEFFGFPKIQHDDYITKNLEFNSDYKNTQHLLLEDPHDHSSSNDSYHNIVEHEFNEKNESYKIHHEDGNQLKFSVNPEQDTEEHHYSTETEAVQSDFVRASSSSGSEVDEIGSLHEEHDIIFNTLDDTTVPVEHFWRHTDIEKIAEIENFMPTKKAEIENDGYITSESAAVNDYKPVYPDKAHDEQTSSYINELVLERLTKSPVDHHSSSFEPPSTSDTGNLSKTASILSSDFTGSPSEFDKEATQTFQESVLANEVSLDQFAFTGNSLLITDQQTAGTIFHVNEFKSSSPIQQRNLHQVSSFSLRNESSAIDESKSDSSSLASNHPQWHRPLSSYPVYGSYFVCLHTWSESLIRLAIEVLMTVHLGMDGVDVTASSSIAPGQSMGIPGLNGKRLLVKIVKAIGVGCEKTVAEAYAVVEMDEPPQKFTTSVVKDTSSPFWDEQFLFDLSDGTLELLFELYDKTDGNFLGLGIVGIEELVATPSQRQIIPLQSRPYEDDEVSGSLTVEFLFLDRADLPDLTLRSSATTQSLSSKGDLVTTTTTTYVKAPDSKAVTCELGYPSPGTYRRRESYRKANNIRSDVIVNGGDGVAAAVLRDIEEKKVAVTSNANKSTMIIHASRKSAFKSCIIADIQYVNSHYQYIRQELPYYAIMHLQRSYEISLISF